MRTPDLRSLATVLALAPALALATGCPPDDTGTDTTPVDTGGGTGCEVDEDGDGYCADGGALDDCDDNNAFVHPDMPEIPYDGVDQDCDGEDWNDVDEDGYPGGTDGTDCVDNDPRVYPGARVPYEECDATNKIDFDCDGTPETEDCDLDGFTIPQGDCNDENPDIYPGAEETWYNGIDESCKAWSDFDKDFDGDDLEPQEGWPLAEWPDKVMIADPEGLTRFIRVDKTEFWEKYIGLDCDDEDPSIGGNLPEPWDGVDRNCDEVVDTLRAADTWKEIQGVGRSGDSKLGWNVVNLGDLDGDGFDEIATADPHASETADPWFGRVSVFSSQTEEDKAPDAAMVTIEGANAGSFIGWSIRNAGDLTGDNRAELLVGTPLLGTFVFSGNTLADGGTLGIGDSLATLRLDPEAEIPIYDGLEFGSGGDITGDGVPDIVHSNGTGVGDPGQFLTIAVTSGAEVAKGGVFGPGQAEVTIRNFIDPETEVAEEFRGGGLDMDQDLDGDGQGDLAFAATKVLIDNANLGFQCGEGVDTAWVHVASGDDLAGAETAARTDFAGISGEQCLGLSLGAVQDLDGDGYAELLIGDPSYTPDTTGATNSGQVFVVDGDDFEDGKVAADLAWLTFRSEESGDWVKVPHEVADHDGDGNADLILGTPTTPDLFQAINGRNVPVVGAAHHLPYTVWSGGGTYDLRDDAPARFTRLIGGSGAAAIGYSWATSQLDDEGGVDLAMGSPFADGGYLMLFTSALADTGE